MMPSRDELYSLYDSFNSIYFQDKLPSSKEVMIEFSGRLTASAGICFPRKKIIRLSTHYHEKFPDDCAATLLHEMIHLAVPGHGEEFKAWIRVIRSKGGSVERRPRERATQAVFRWKYICVKCMKEYFRKRRLKNGGRNFLCSLCKSKLNELKLPKT
ncbi:MAG: SprT-like domain-containing protein [Bacillota bacterium]|nr:SprT-like domain-containing protein [Bacillota bacterium]